MAYEKQTWKNGDIITEQKLNHIENGIAGSGGGGGGVMFVNFTGTASEPVADKTLEEIATAIQNGQLVVFVDNITTPASLGSGIATKRASTQDEVSFFTIIFVPLENGPSYLELGYDSEGAYYYRPFNPPA